MIDGFGTGANFRAVVGLEGGLTFEADDVTTRVGGRALGSIATDLLR